MVPDLLKVNRVDGVLLAFFAPQPPGGLLERNGFGFGKRSKKKQFPLNRGASFVENDGNDILKSWIIGIKWLRTYSVAFVFSVLDEDVFYPFIPP